MRACVRAHNKIQNDLECTRKNTVNIIFAPAGFIKLCSVHTPSSNPNRKPARQLTLRRQSQQARNQRNARNRPNANNRGNPRQSRDFDDPPPYPGAPMEMHGARR